MATKIYGASDDLIEFDGDISGEVGNYGTDDAEHGELIVCSDATVLEVKYGKSGQGIWEVKLLRRGPLFKRIDICVDEDVKIYSDIAYFDTGLKWAYAASEWESVK